MSERRLIPLDEETVERFREFQERRLYALEQAVGEERRDLLERDCRLLGSIVEAWDEGLTPIEGQALLESYEIIEYADESKFGPHSLALLQRAQAKLRSAFSPNYPEREDATR